MDEFALIREFFTKLAPHGGDVVLGIGDDAAILAVPAPWQLAVCTDTLVAGHHFPLDTVPADIGWKALAVNLSDLAAMGAVPRWFTLALTLPVAEAGWLAGFTQGLAALAQKQSVALVGGDTTRGPLSVTVTAGGWVEPGTALRRSGAQVGDVVCVTGTLGDAALALRCLTPPSGAKACPPALRARLDRPTPRVGAGRVLREHAHAAIDISDGLAADLGHILAASGVGAMLQAEALPRSAAFSACASADAQALQLHGGDDYELCACLPPAAVAAAQAGCAQAGVALTVIGEVVAERGLWIDTAGVRSPCPPRGFDHFAVEA
ncbi:MAG: thiamine-phosphate kinase [Nevskiaceae bacterium]|nr:MAG: thiamine-phosphate kinase [Nevskiaceae bacterium]TBR74737.1 MAG: thiamine-phosphate kinase [Nevskiaceae bacterium]